MLPCVSWVDLHGSSSFYWNNTDFIVMLANSLNMSRSCKDILYTWYVRLQRFWSNLRLYARWPSKCSHLWLYLEWLHLYSKKQKQNKIFAQVWFFFNLGWCIDAVVKTNMNLTGFGHLDFWLVNFIISFLCVWLLTVMVS